MSRIAKIASAGALLLALTAGVARNLIQCPAGLCVGTNEDDQITGTDRINALDSRDDVDALGDDDQINGGPGDDGGQDAGGNSIALS